MSNLAWHPEELAMDAPVLFRCSSLADIMTDAKAKGEVLSVGAKTAVKNLVRQSLYGARGRVDNKYLRKGIECEQISIDLLNDVTGGMFKKNEERRSNQWITGEPDIIAKGHGVDIKTSWSMDTFPLLSEDGDDKTYEWQCRGYMMLFDKPKWDVAYCLVDTPDHLIGYDDPAIHKVSHIDTRLRVTVVQYERDMELEEKIRVKAAAAQAYYQELRATILNGRGVLTPFVSQPGAIKADAKSAFSIVK